MPHVYVIRSVENGRTYIGSTDRTPADRLRDHNAGKNASTADATPWELIYTEPFASYELAQKRERFFKTGHGRRTLKNLLPKQLEPEVPI